MKTIKKYSGQILNDLLIRKFLNWKLLVNLISSRAFHVIKKLDRTKKESIEINPKIFP
jgi:hypothetical protein